MGGERRFCHANAMRTLRLKMKAKFSQLIDLVHRFRSDSRGNIGITFAFALLPIMAFVGAAIDYSRASAVKAEMQSAVDSVGLMLYRTAPSMDPTQLKTAAENYLQATFAKKYGADNIQVKATYSTSGGSNIQVTASADVPTTFMEMFGYKAMTVSSSTTAKWGYQRLRVALVLDNTGSMSRDGKMDALKTATKKLLTQLQGAATVDGDVYVSIVPFVKDVNLDPGNYSANWIDWTEWNTKNGTCSNTDYHSQSSCEFARQNLDARRSQHLERLRRRPRRPESCRTPAITTPMSRSRPPASRRRCLRPSSIPPVRRRRWG